MKAIRPRLTTRTIDAIKPRPKVADPHYQTADHKAWRRAVIARAGQRCQWEGCMVVGGLLYADHVVEIRDGGAKLDLSNGQCLCPKHHALKTHQERLRRVSR